MSGPSQGLDPTNVLLILLATVLSREVAAVVAPYIAIVISSAVGAAWAVGRRDPANRGNGFLFFARLIGTALILTVTLATICHSYFGVDDPQLLFAPIALIVGAVGDDWPRVGNWLAGLARSALELVVAKRGGPPPGGPTNG